MKDRKKWLEENEELAKCFDRAFTLTEELSKELVDKVDFSVELDTLSSHRQSWEDHRFEIVVVGEFSTGKSTFINALLQKEVLPSKVTPTTATINYIRHINDGPGYEVAVVNYQDQRTEEVAFDTLDEYVTEMSKNLEVAEEVHHVDLFIDSSYLKDGVVIVDTPGLQALHEEHERITKEQIKKSHASIFLSNMEQLGKQTEFQLLREVKESIDRIFFIGNRLDGIPKGEVEEVVESFEEHLKDNTYCSIEEQYAKLYPVSALQALKARDQSVTTKYWNDYTPEQLLEESRFDIFESRLEEYLFGGDKAKDALKAPKRALSHHYEQLLDKLNGFEQVLKGEVDVEKLEEEQQRLGELIELRKLQLNEQVRELEKSFDEAIYLNNKEFEEKYKMLENELKLTIEEAPTVTDLYEDIQYDWAEYYQRYDRMTENSMRDLATSLNALFREKVQELGEVKLSEDDTKIDIELIEIEQNERTNNKVQVNIRELIDSEFDEELQELEEEGKKLQLYHEKKRQLERKERKVERHQEYREEDLRFHETLLNSTPPNKKVEKVVGKKFFFFDKKEMVEVSNDQYEEQLKQLRKVRKEQRISEQKMLEEVEASEDEVNDALEDLGYLSREELRERRNEIMHQKRARTSELLSVEQRKKERELKRERRRIQRQLEGEMMMHKRAYRNQLRSLDALDLAKKRIEQQIMDADQELRQQEQEFLEKKQMLEASKEEQQRLQTIVEEAKENLEQEQILLV